MARKKRRPYGSGTVWQNKAGEWFARFPLGSRQYRTVRVADESAGLAWLAEQHKQRAGGADMVNTQMLMRDFLLRWLNSQARRVKASTLDSYKDLIEYYILGFIGDVRLGDLKPQHVRAMIETLYDEGKAPSQLRNAVNLLGRALDMALKDELVLRNVARLVADEVPDGTDYQGYVLTIAEVRRFLAVVADDRLALLYTLALILGLRKGELLGLSWSNVHESALTITITRQVQYFTGGLIFSTPKTESSRRTLPITPAIVALFRAQWQRLQVERERAGMAWHEHGLVFPADNGNPKQPSNLLREFKAHLVRAGIQVRERASGDLTSAVRLHDLRGTAATRLGEVGTEEYVISAMLGHGQNTVTRKYAKATLLLMRQGVEAVERLYQGEAGEQTKPAQG